MFTNGLVRIYPRKLVCSISVSSENRAISLSRLNFPEAFINLSSNCCFCISLGRATMQASSFNIHLMETQASLSLN